MRATAIVKLTYALAAAQALPARMTRVCLPPPAFLIHPLVPTLYPQCKSSTKPSAGLKVTALQFFRSPKTVQIALQPVLLLLLLLQGQ